AREIWRSAGGPMEQELTAQLEVLDDAQEQLGVERAQREAWLLEHPTALRRLATLDHEAQRLELETGITTPDQVMLRTPTPSPSGPGLAI
ncbi:MAG: hypothetical protein OSA99_11635, partial [Acidimicrobiales bacterium]|nr:hypothetical protein [Acidimicrobiales bacterium]